MKKNLLILFFSFICFGFQKKEVKTDSIDYYIAQKKPIKALNYSRAQTENLLSQKKYLAFCNAMQKRANLFINLNDNENAINTLYESLKIAEKYNLLEKQINIYTSLGSIYTITFDLSKAKNKLYRAKNLANKLNKSEFIARAYQQLYLYHTAAETDSVEFYLKKVDFCIKESNDLKLKYVNASNFGTYYLNKFNTKLSKEYFLKAIQYAYQANDKTRIVKSKNNLGVYYLSGEKNYTKAIEIYKEIINLLSENESPYDLSNAYLNISYAYEKLGDYKSAMDFNNKYLEIQDVVFNGKLEQASQEIETKYQISKVEEEYKHKTQELVDKQERNQKLMYLLLTLLVLVAVIFYVFFQNLKLKQKNKIKDLDTDLQYKIISATLDGQDQERNKISEVLHDNVSATLSSVGLHLSAFESSLTAEQRSDLRKTRALLKQAHDKVRDLSHELVPPLLVKFGLQFALKDLCENNSNSLAKFTYNSELPKNKKFDHEFETKIFYFVSELFNNAIKHSQATEIDLNLKEREGKLQIIVSDNGVGFNTKDKPLGFGLTQIKARVKNMDGNVKLFSKPDEGTIITIIVKE
ncbi:MAG: sensor histidine kinase [Bacteroidota bacterium]